MVIRNAQVTVMRAVTVKPWKILFFELNLHRRAYSWLPDHLSHRLWNMEYGPYEPLATHFQSTFKVSHAWTTISLSITASINFRFTKILLVENNQGLTRKWLMTTWSYSWLGYGAEAERRAKSAYVSAYFKENFLDHIFIAVELDTVNCNDRRFVMRTLAHNN